MMVRYILNTNQQLIGLRLIQLTILIKATVFVIDRNEYRLDDNGYLHIPEGTACLTETIEIIQ